jgi:acetoin utilization protein AcuB
MRVSDIMTANPATVYQDDTLRDALAAMECIHCHHIPVVGRDGRVLGILSTEDFRIALDLPSAIRKRWQDEQALDHLMVNSLMTLSPIVIHQDAPAEEAARLMIDREIGCLPVVHENRLVGIVTSTDVLRAFIHLPKLPNLPSKPMMPDFG